MKDAMFWLVVLVLVILFTGDPDLHDILLEKIEYMEIYHECV